MRSTSICFIAVCARTGADWSEHMNFGLVGLLWCCPVVSWYVRRVDAILQQIVILNVILTIRCMIVGMPSFETLHKWPALSKILQVNHQAWQIDYVRQYL